MADGGRSRFDVDELQDEISSSSSSCSRRVGWTVVNFPAFPGAGTREAVVVPASRECRMGESPAPQAGGRGARNTGSAFGATVLVPASERVPVAVAEAEAVPEPALRERSGLRTGERTSQALYSSRGGLA